MPQALALCLEDLHASADGRYLRCVALPGRQAGLRISQQGAVSWKISGGVACEMWVSADDQLILLRPPGAVPVIVERAGRRLDVPTDKPVVLIDQDVFRVCGRTLRVHVHGVAETVTPPSPLLPRKAGSTRLAALMALGAVVAGCDKPPVEVRDRPPAIASPPSRSYDPEQGESSDRAEAPAPSGSATTPPSAAASTTKLPPR